MKNKYLLLLSLFALTISVHAQDVKPVFETLEFDLIARTKPRLDLNDVPCAVLRVSAADIQEYVFEGNIIGEVVYSPGEALVYMTDNSRNITIKSNLFGMMRYEFPERLKKQVAYKLSLKLDIPEAKVEEISLDEVLEQSKKQLKKKSTKTARQEAKQFKKDGWKNSPGSMPIDKQLDKSYAMQQEYDGNFDSKFIMGEGIGRASTYELAREKAELMAKRQLAGMIETAIAAKTENAIAERLLSPEEAESLMEMVQKTRTLVVQQLGKLEPVMQLYRDTDSGKEVLIRFAYNSNNSKKQAIETIRTQLDLSSEWGEKLGTILGVHPQ